MTTRVLVPVDGSDNSWRALEHAVDHYDSADVTVLHVIEPATDSKRETKKKQRAADLLERAKEIAADSETTVQTDTRTGEPAETIVEYATDSDVDVIVMGSRGRSGLSRLLLGSVAEYVVRRSPTPVAVIR